MPSNLQTKKEIIRVIIQDLLPGEIVDITESSRDGALGFRLEAGRQGKELSTALGSHTGGRLLIFLKGTVDGERIRYYAETCRSRDGGSQQ